MAMIVTICWCLLALLHLAPAAVLVMPGLVTSLYGIAPDGDIGVLVIHRGALFLGVLSACLWAAFDARVRSMAVVITAVSMLGFLLVYARAGMPPGSLRGIAIADAIGLIPLALVGFAALRSSAMMASAE